MGEVLAEFAAGHWRTVAVGLVAIGLAFWIGILRLERDSARAQVAVDKTKLDSLMAQVASQNAAVESWKLTAEKQQKSAAEALAAVEGQIKAWQDAAKALAEYKRTDALVVKYRTVEVGADECKVAKGLAVDAWDRRRSAVGVQHSGGTEER